MAETAGMVDELRYGVRAADHNIQRTFPSLGNKTQKQHMKNSGLRIFSVASLFVSSMKFFQKQKAKTAKGLQGGVVGSALTSLPQWEQSLPPPDAY